MWDVTPTDLSPREIQGLLAGGVAPRPIALVSTISEDGVSNLAPFSFFNAFGSNPPMVAFSPARRGRDGSLKDTYRNLVAVRECVIQAVTHAMVAQVNLAAAEYPPDVDEFAMSGLTPVDSDLVHPKRVKESPFQMECRLTQMIPLGEEKGSGNLALCEVVKFHVAERILTDRRIDPRKVDQVGRNGAAVYTRAFGDALFDLEMPVQKLGVGWEALPEAVKRSTLLTANELGRLATIEAIPDRAECERVLSKYVPSDEISEGRFGSIWERAAREAISRNELALAWALLLRGDEI